MAQEHDWKAIREAFERGTPLRDLERQFEVGRGTVSKRAHREGWSKPETGNRKPSSGKPKPRKVSEAKPGEQEERKPGQQWTEYEKAEALKVYVETASVIKTSNTTGVPARTIYRWLDEDSHWREAAVQASRVCARILEDRAEAILVNLLKGAESGDGKEASMAMRGIDTLQRTLSFIRGGPTDRTETNQVSPEEWRRGRKEKSL